MRRVAESVVANRAVIVGMFAFASLEQQPDVCAALRKALGEIHWPILWVQGKPCAGEPLAGLQIFALKEIRVERITCRGKIVGTIYEQAGMRQCLLADIAPHIPRATRGQQADEIFRAMAEILEGAGFAMGDVVRTWFYNEDILAWYPEFNRIRSQFYSRIPFRSASAPASTGVAGRNPHGTALTSAVWAVQPLDASVQAEEVASPLQCPALAYGSSFSRALEVTSTAARRLFISGTASIAPAGETLWRGNARWQIDQTMQVVEAILASRGYALADLNRAIAYFKHGADAPLFAEWCAARGVSIPFIPIECDICRDDLLFEIEADAFRYRS
jgi:enamine deaminase RidA (YjgF/YER057c/UK114 family)